MRSAATASTRGSIRSAPERACATSSATTAAACRAASRTASPAAAATRAHRAAGPATRIRSSCRSTSSMAAFRAATTAQRPAHRAVAATSSPEPPASGRRSRPATPAMSSGTWYVTNNPSTQNMTKQSLGNRSFINQVKYSPKFERGDRRHERRQRVDRLQSRHGHRLPGELGQRHRQQHRPSQPARARHRARPGLADARPGDGLCGGRRLQRQHADARRATSSRYVHRELRVVHLGEQVGQPARHPGRLGHRQPPTRRRSSPAPTGALLHGRHHGEPADVVQVRERPAARDDLGHADRPRRDDALCLDARPRRLRLAA